MARKNELTRAYMHEAYGYKWIENCSLSVVFPFPEYRNNEGEDDNSSSCGCAILRRVIEARSVKEKKSLYTIIRHYRVYTGSQVAHYWSRTYS